jgi:anti-anti-sigma factor
VRIEQFNCQGCVVLALHGRLDLAAAPQVQRAILEQLAKRWAPVICDLSQVDSIDPLCAGVFTSLRHPALGWPGSGLLLCCAAPEVAETLTRLRAAGRLPMYHSVGEALANARSRAPHLRERLALGPVPSAARAGRVFVRQVCSRWGLDALAEPATLLASELVTNAVVHARTALELRVELRGHRLQVAVRDHEKDPPRLLATSSEEVGGLGLVLVDRLAKAWGVRPSASGGKVVWCTLELPLP